MNGGPTSDKGLERVIHLFASGAKPPEVKKKQEEAPQPKRAANACYVLNTGGGMAQTFYCCNLGVRLAEKGINFALLDLETKLPTAAYLFGGLAEEPAIADIIRPSSSKGRGIYRVAGENHIIVDEKSALKLISLTVEGYNVISAGERDPSLIDSFTTLLGEMDLTLINLPEALIGTPFVDGLPVSRFLVVTRPGLDEVMRTFSLMRDVVGRYPDAGFGLLVHRAKDMAEVRSAFTSLSRAVRESLGRDLRFMGAVS